MRNSFKKYLDFPAVMLNDHTNLLPSARGTSIKNRLRVRDDLLQQ